MNVIDKIRAEIERRIKESNNDIDIGAIESLTINKSLRSLLSFLDTLEENQEIGHQERFDKIISLMKKSHKENRCFFESDDIKYLESLKAITD